MTKVERPRVNKQESEAVLVPVEGRPGISTYNVAFLQDKRRIVLKAIMELEMKRLQEEEQKGGSSNSG